MEHGGSHAEGARGDHDRLAGGVVRDALGEFPADAECAFEHAAEFAGVAPQSRAFQTADHFTRGWYLPLRLGFSRHLEIGQNQPAFFGFGGKE